MERNIESGSITPSDLERLARAEAPDFLDVLSAYIAEAADVEVDPGTPHMSLAALKAALAQASRARLRARRRELARDAWQRYLAQEPAQIAPQLELASLIEQLAAREDAFARSALLFAAAELPFLFGAWGGLKRVYKRAERDLDSRLFGALAARFDREIGRGDVSVGTLVYMRRRAARTLRKLGKAAPELYPQVAVDVLRSVPADARVGEVVQTILSARSEKWGAPVGLPKSDTFRPPYREAWAASPEPLLLLAVEAKAREPARFAIDGLKALFPALLRRAPPAFLARLAASSLREVHDFLIELLEGSAHAQLSQLKALGLHAAVLGLLESPSDKARAYAITYARTLGDELDAEFLLALLARSGSRDVIDFVGSLLRTRPPRVLGARVLLHLLGVPHVGAWAAEMLGLHFAPSELSESLLVDVLFGGSRTAIEWVARHVATRAELGSRFWLSVLSDPRIERGEDALIERAFGELAKQPTASVPGAWVLDALARPDLAWHVAEWLRTRTELPPELPLERFKQLVFDRRYRALVLQVLERTTMVAPRTLGLSWLLALSRSSQTDLRAWAQRYVLRNMTPDDFGDAGQDGLTRLFALAIGDKQDALRELAQLYLRSHHPVIATLQPELRATLAGEPRIPIVAYTRERLWPALSDPLPDVRRFAASIVRVSLRRWGALASVYELAESPHKEVRNIAYEALTQAGEPQASPELALTLEELDAASIFGMTESPRASTREVALTLIGKHYALLGGIDRLGWLMQSADREVRLFAVRLLWERHRPRSLPAGWKPKHGQLARDATFDDTEALRALLRRVLFTLPPGREGMADVATRRRKLPASQVKLRVIELVRDFALEDVAFAALVAPVFAEFCGSLARGEWQACLSALLTLRARHDLALEGMI